MVVIKTHYQDSAAGDKIIAALDTVLNGLNVEPLFICIGSEHHLLDCLGPLTGTMLKEAVPDLPVYGTLENPLHARNLVKEIRGIEKLYADKIKIAIDASVGDEKEIGVIQLRQGSLLPGKALAKNLPAIGEFSITGIVDIRFGHEGRITRRPGLAHVYQMAKLLSDSIAKWHNRKIRTSPEIGGF